MTKNKNTLRMTLAAVLLICSALVASFSDAHSHSPTIVPLYFGENRGPHGENLPMQENIKNLFTDLEKDLHIQFQLRFFPWNRAVKMASTEGGLIFGLSSTPEREQIFSFTIPALYNHIWLVTRHDRMFEYHSIHDLKGKTIGVVRGARYGGEFDANRGILFKVDDDLDSYDIRLRKVIEKRVDGMLYASSLDDVKEVEKAVNKIALLGLKMADSRRFRVVAVPILKNDLRFAILKDSNEELIQKINHSLEKLQKKSIKRP